MYEEQVRHARHHETLRTQSTNVIIVLSGAVLAFLSSDAASSGQHIVLPLFLILTNVYGFIMSIKHYERSRVAHGSRREVSSDDFSLQRRAGKQLE